MATQLPNTTTSIEPELTVEELYKIVDYDPTMELIKYFSVWIIFFVLCFVFLYFSHKNFRHKKRLLFSAFGVVVVNCFIAVLLFGIFEFIFNLLGFGGGGFSLNSPEHFRRKFFARIFVLFWIALVLPMSIFFYKQVGIWIDLKKRKLFILGCLFLSIAIFDLIYKSSAFDILWFLGG